MEMKGWCLVCGGARKEVVAMVVAYDGDGGCSHGDAAAAVGDEGGGGDDWICDIVRELFEIVPLPMIFPLKLLPKPTLPPSYAL
ncbi:hypothetical protein Tco_0737570 [Tanacetum coccineum]